jgi:excisionase family DNA binding protein
MLPVVLTVKQIAKQLNVSGATVYGWVMSGALACYRLGAKGRRGAIRVAEADLVAFLESLKTQRGQQAVKPPAPRRKIKLQHLQLPG